MQPTRLSKLLKQRGKLEKHAAGQIYHTQDFPDTLFMLKKGFVKRYQFNVEGDRIIELIYGPGHIFPLSQLYRILYNIELNQEDLVYAYQAMTDIEIMRISDQIVVEELDRDPMLYSDLFYEAGLRLKTNIDRLASNALKDDYKKITHQLVDLADEFGKATIHRGKPVIKISVPLQPVDMAEQLNISIEVTEAIMNSLVRNELIIMKGNFILVPDISLLKDQYLTKLIIAQQETLKKKKK